MIAKLIGIIGLLLISSGVLLKKRKMQDEFYFFGGLCLLFYSISLRDLIFIILQVIFIIVAAYDFEKRSFKLFKTKRRS